METTSALVVLERKLSSYRTYEEWKRKYRIPSKQSILSSYRTYEEWKLPETGATDSRIVGSYRTYEEWKPELVLHLVQ